MNSQRKSKSKRSRPPANVVANSEASTSSKQTANVVNVSGVPRLMSNALHPQGCSFHHVKSLNTTQPKDQQHISESELKSTKLLAGGGIKARDFAYESRLPPIRSVPHFRVQIQSIPRALKRSRGDYEEGEEGDDYVQQTFYFDAETGGTTVGLRRRAERKPVERTPTEPVDEPASSHFRQRRRLDGADFSLRREMEATLDPRRTVPPARYTTPNARTSAGQEFDSLPQLDTQETSQESEPWIATPLVTPSGSLQMTVTNNSDVPASQLDTPSRLPPPTEDAIFSQLAFSPERSPSNAPSVDVPSTLPPIRALSLQRQIARTPSPTPHLSPMPTSFSPARDGPRVRPRKKQRTHVTESTQVSRSTRYNLRDRTAPPLRFGASDRGPSRAASSRHEASAKRSSPVKSPVSPKKSTSRRQPRKPARGGR